MKRTAKSQWEFGELFPASVTRRVLSVTELTGQIKRLLEQSIGVVWVSGEITNLRAQASGHIYFTVKDASAQLSCVLFRGESQVNRELLADGRKVLIQGQLTVYEPRGQYQLRVTGVEPQGVGALQLAFEQLKQKLNAEGLFAPERKRPLPRFPEAIGVVTSATGAALQDVLHVIQRRNPALRLILAPCRVQGAGAGQEIANAITRLNAWADTQGQEGGRRGIDVILVTRGGGSLEDLWAFNEEVVARAIHQSRLPVVSAVGHEIDFTISDFVADLRAATPSAAAEILTEGAVASRQYLGQVGARMGMMAWDRLEQEKERLSQLTDRLRRAHPRGQLDARWQRLDELRSTLVAQASLGYRDAVIRWQTWQTRWARLRPSHLLTAKRELVVGCRACLHETLRLRFQALQHRHATVAERLRLLSPRAVLARGYSITLDSQSGRVVRSAHQTQAGQELRSVLAEGEVRSRVGGACESRGESTS